MASENPYDDFFKRTYREDFYLKNPFDAIECIYALGHPPFGTMEYGDYFRSPFYKIKMDLEQPPEESKN